MSILIEQDFVKSWVGTKAPLNDSLLCNNEERGLIPPYLQKGKNKGIKEDTLELSETETSILR